MNLVQVYYRVERDVSHKFGRRLALSIHSPRMVVGQQQFAHHQWLCYVRLLGSGKFRAYFGFLTP